MPGWWTGRNVSTEPMRRLCERIAIEQDADCSERENKQIGAGSGLEVGSNGVGAAVGTRIRVVRGGEIQAFTPLGKGAITPFPDK